MALSCPEACSRPRSIKSASNVSCMCRPPGRAIVRHRVADTCVLSVWLSACRRRVLLNHGKSGEEGVQQLFPRLRRYVRLVFYAREMIRYCAPCRSPAVHCVFNLPRVWTPHQNTGCKCRMTRTGSNEWCGAWNVMTGTRSGCELGKSWDTPVCRLPAAAYPVLRRQGNVPTTTP